MINQKTKGRPFGRTGKARAITDKEFNAVFAVTRLSERYALRNTALLVLSNYLGLRVKEMSSLKVGDIFDGAQLMKTLRLLAGYTKGNKHRDISLENKRVVNALEDYINERKATDGRFKLESPLFLSQKGGHLSPNALARIFIIMYREAGLKNATSHSGRRSLITKLAYKGIDLNSIRQIAGHRSISTTQRYIEDRPDLMAEILKAV